MGNKNRPQTFKSVWLIGLCSLMAALGGCKKTAEPTGAAAYKVVKPYEKGPLQVQVKVSGDTIALSDLLLVELDGEIESGYSVVFPKLSDNLIQFKILDDHDLGKKLGANNKISISHCYRLEPLTQGECTLPAMQFLFQKEGQDTQDRLNTEPITIQVTTTIIADPNQTIADIEDVVEMPTHYLPWIISAIVAAVIGLGIWIGLRLRPKKAAVIHKVYKPAHEIAFEMLRKLSEEKLVEQGMIKEFYEKLSFCLRLYIENRFLLRAPEQTTEEFLESLKKSDFLKLEYKQELKRFLEHCDLVKFAKYHPDNEQINQSLTMAGQFVENTKSEDSQVEMKKDILN
jgi:hypothetical protein